MWVLHCHWITGRESGEEGELFVWAESSSGTQPKGDGDTDKLQPHPFLVRTGPLKGVLSLLKLPLATKSGSHALWLPSNSFPLPSPQLIHEWEIDSEAPELRLWEVSGLLLPVAQALAFLSALTEIDLPPSIQLGSDGRYWQLVFNFALELLARQLVQPALTERQEEETLHYEARWLPVIDGEREAQRLAQLAAAMPAICRAKSATLEEVLPPRLILHDFLKQIVDTAAREWHPGEGFYLPAGSEPAHAWVRALFSAYPTVKASEALLPHFVASYRAWKRALSMAGNQQYRVGFRLDAPSKKTRTKKGEGTWHLHYLLQARDDSNLVVPATEVWKSQSRVLEALGRHFERPQEQLLTGLGYAARFFVPIQRSLQMPNPTSVMLTSDEAYTFLRHCAPQLQRSGFGLLVPPWWNKPGTRLGVRLQLGSGTSTVGKETISSGHISFDNLINFQWELSLGETTLTPEEFDALVALKSPLVEIRGQWVQLDPSQIEAAIEFWKQQTLNGSVSLQNAIHLALDSGETQGDLPIDGIELDEWLQKWLDHLQGEQKLEMLQPPEGLNATLRPYQQYGYSWLHFAREWGIGVILADDMGLGKTIQCLSLIIEMKNKMKKLPAPILLVCPTSVVTNWQQEGERFTPDLKMWVHQGIHRLQDEAFVAAAQASDMVITSYPVVRRDGDILAQVEWFGVVLDEAQNIKNPNTKQARVIRGLESNFRLALTGTPVENRLSELWSIMQFLNPGFLGSQKRFHKDFIIPIEKHGDDEVAERLRNLTRPFILRRLKTDPTVIQELPDKQEVKVYCHLSEEQTTLYESVVRDALAVIEQQKDNGMARRGLVLSMLMRLKQVCNHPAQYLHDTNAYNPLADKGRSGKLLRLHELLEEILAEGDRLLIFSQFTEMGHLLRKYIRRHFGVNVLYLHGSVKAEKRSGMVRRFQEDENGPPVFILSLRAGGTGLNLTRANHVFHFDRWWNPAVEDQATDRAFRIGQTKNVLVHKFVCLGTLEERIDEMLTEKRALADSIIGSGENWLTEMSTASLRELVSLREL